MRRVMAALVLLILAATGVFAADEQPRVDEVTPARVGDLVVAHFVTSGLPGSKLLQSMQSGLVSAIEVDLALLDDRDKVVGGNQVSLQLGFDLWEELFSVFTAGSERRFQTLVDLQTYLARPEMMPVIPVSNLLEGARYRVRVGLRVHPIAPAEQARVEDVIAGVSQPYYLALDIAGGKVYWSDLDSPTIHRANLDGTGREDFITGLDRVRDILRQHNALR